MTLTQKTERTYRASSANLNWLCPAAAHSESDEVLINPVDDAGTMGTATHEACAKVVLNETVAFDSLQRQHGLDDKQRRELEILTAIFARFWSEYGPLFRQGDITRVLDIKTTRLEAVNYQPQMKKYLLLSATDPTVPVGLHCEQPMEVRVLGDDDPWIESGHADVIWVPEHPQGWQYIVLYLRDRTIEVSETFTGEQLAEWNEEYTRRIREWDRHTYNPGGHCQYCPRQTQCPGLHRQLALLAAVVTSTALENAVNTAQPAMCVDLWEKSGLLLTLIARAREIIKARAEREGGSLQGDGKALVLKKEEWEIIADPQKAWPVLQTQLTDDEIKACVEVSKKAVLDLIADKAPKRGKGKAKEAFMDELRAAGALGTDGRIMPRIVAALPAATEKEMEGDDNGE